MKKTINILLLLIITFLLSSCFTTKNDVENAKKGIEKIISTEDSKIKVLSIPTNEEVMIARDTLRLI